GRPVRRPGRPALVGGAGRLGRDLDGSVPDDVVVVDPGRRPLGDQEPEHQGQGQGAHQPAAGAGGLGAAGACPPGDDAPPPPATQPLVGGQGLGDLGQVAQAFGQDHGVLGGHGGALPRGGRGGGGGVAG